LLNFVIALYARGVHGDYWAGYGRVGHAKESGQLVGDRVGVASGGVGVMPQHGVAGCAGSPYDTFHVGV